MGDYEFTDDGGLIPWTGDRLDWPREILEREGWEPTGLLGYSLGDPVVAEIYSHDATNRTLIGLEIYGVAATILCRTKLSFLQFARIWLRPLVELNPPEPRFGPSSQRGGFDEVRHSPVSTTP